MIGNVIESLRAAWDGLSANKMRSALTMLGVIIGVGAVIALLSLGEGAQAEITQQINSIGTNLVFVAPGTFASQGPGQTSVGQAATLTYEDALAAADPRNVPDAKIVAPEYTSNAQIIFGDADINTAVTGTIPEYLEAFTLEVASGRFLEDADLASRAGIAVLGSDAAGERIRDGAESRPDPDLAPNQSGTSHHVRRGRTGGCVGSRPAKVGN